MLEDGVLLQQAIDLKLIAMASGLVSNSSQYLNGVCALIKNNYPVVMF